ncbi:MAG: ribosome-associated translation inhibitor RaiA [Clostridia bacterium]|nr:ribosome-associated translation inhibitor RaiA [Clostridia bacterium]
MKLDITGLHIEVTDAIKEFTEKKVEKLAKFFDDATICHVTFSAEREKQHVDIRIEYKSRTYIGKTETDDVYYGIEEVINKLEGQIRKNKAIIEKKRRQGATEEELDALKIEDLLNEEV